MEFIWLTGFVQRCVSSELMTCCGQNRSAKSALHSLDVMVMRFTTLITFSNEYTDKTVYGDKYYECW
jgi:hypothetical protein